MKLPRYVVYVLLLFLFVGAAWIRIDQSGRSESPYFKGESGTNYRYAYMIGQRGHPPQIDKKAAFPEGYEPARVKAMGVEFMAGYLYKLVRYFSAMNERIFIRILTALFFSLMVWIVYGLSYALWRCRAGAFFSAALVAFSVPLIAATDGSAFTHLPYAAVGAGLHLLLVMRYLKKPSLWAALAAALLALALLSLWEGALIYLLPALLLVAVRSRRDYSALLKFVSPHLVAVAGAAVLFPHFGGGESAWNWSYLVYRLRYVFGKPTDPAALPADIRLLWTRAHSFPQAYTLAAIFLPLAVLIPAITGGLRTIARERGISVKPVVAVAIGAAMLVILDRSTIVFAVPALALVAAPAFYGFSRRIKTRVIFVALACFLFATQLAFPRSAADLTWRAGAAAGITSGGEEFAWVSIGNADLDLVTFLSTRTTTRAPFLSSPELSPLILTFAGRTTTLVPGIETAAMLEKTRALMGALYADEDELYRACTERGIAYVLYSIDMALDGSRYSLRYQNDAVDPGRESAVFKMHFFPEDLAHFELVYENDIYRVFKIVEETHPIFLSDHPLVYQYDVLIRNRENLSSFYDRVVRLISMYALAANASGRGEWSAAVNLYQQCITEAPQFTKARLGLGNAFLAQKEWGLARPVFLSVVNYTPDNQEALFGAAFAMYYLEEWDDARRYLTILIQTPGGDKEIVKRARGLRMAVAEKLEGNQQ